MKNESQPILLALTVALGRSEFDSAWSGDREEGARWTAAHEGTHDSGALLNIIQRYWLIPAITTLVGTSVAYVFASRQQKVYEAHGDVFFNLSVADNAGSPDPSRAARTQSALALSGSSSTRQPTPQCRQQRWPPCRRNSILLRPTS